MINAHMDPTDLDARLKRLHLPTVRRLYPELAIRAEAEGMSYLGFLEILISEEIDGNLHKALASIYRGPFAPPLHGTPDPTPPERRRREVRLCRTAACRGQRRHSRHDWLLALSLIER